MFLLFSVTSESLLCLCKELISIYKFSFILSESNDVVFSHEYLKDKFSSLLFLFESKMINNLLKYTKSNANLLML